MLVASGVRGQCISASVCAQRYRIADGRVASRCRALWLLPFTPL